MPTYTLRPGPGLDLSTVPGWASARSSAKARPALAAPARPAPPKASACPSLSSATVEYTEIDDDYDLDSVTRVLASAACLNASRELGLAKAPPVKFFQPMTPLLADYRRQYF